MHGETIKFPIVCSADYKQYVREFFHLVGRTPAFIELNHINYI